MQRSNVAARLLLPAFLLVLALGLLTSNAAAHARLQSASPSDGEVLSSQPSSVTATFGEETALTGSKFEVYFTPTGGSEQRADTASSPVDPNERSKMSATLKSGLGEGKYIVRWTTLTEDDNGKAEGSFSFTVASGSTASGPTGKTGTMREQESTSPSSLPTTGGGGLLPFGLLALAVLALGLALRLTGRRVMR